MHKNVRTCFSILSNLSWSRKLLKAFCFSKFDYRRIFYMNVLTVISHPRQDSLTRRVARRFSEGLIDAGHIVEVCDLYQEELNPVVSVEDEPDWMSSPIN